MDAHKADSSACRLCRLIGVKRSSYTSYIRTQAQRKQRQTEQDSEQTQLDQHITEMVERYSQTIGARRIKTALKREHKLEVSRRRIIERMKALGLKVITRQRYCNRNVAAIDDDRIAANALKRQFNVKGPNQKWVADISYIRTLEGWQYLAVFIDLYSRRVVGWAMDSRMEAQLVKRALLRALWSRKPTRGLIIHTDQGSQFVAKAYRNVLKHWGIKPSMSRRGNCWDNAVVESFFASLKKERVYRTTYATGKQALYDVSDYIGWYNHQRMHSTNDNYSPVEYENQWIRAMKELDKKWASLCTKKG
ncbi:IS3 family transposase [Thiomicrospira microaerophila]|uniref:IS3 family transposase n=1 Tax=Thiomicrospira microaerophila TaxID=406020 RepID=UPI00200C546A|nr:IS3 family transposase [Thiomicrospira microaerophila]